MPNMHEIDYQICGQIYSAAPQRGGSREEGSILGGLGRLIDGDNS
jgi:hypothetical protein